MNEIEEIAERIEAALRKVLSNIADGTGSTKDALDPAHELMLCLRDLRGVKVVLPKEIVSAMKSGSYPNLVAGFNPIKNAGLAMMGDGKITFATTPEQAIAALAEKITKEKG